MRKFIFEFIDSCVTLISKTYFFKVIHNYRKRKSNKRASERQAYFFNEAPELLQHFSEVLNKEGILFWLDFGTLLGYYREHDFIKHDMDLDTGAFLEDAEKIRKVLLANGFSLVREFSVMDDGGKEDCYKYKHTYIDIFYYRKDNDKMYCNSFGPKIRFNALHLRHKIPVVVEKVTVPYSGFKKDTFKGIPVNVPNDVEACLIANYGKSFMIPDPSFDYKEGSNCITSYTYEEKPGEAIFYEMI